MYTRRVRLPCLCMRNNYLDRLSVEFSRKRKKEKKSNETRRREPNGQGDGDTNTIITLLISRVFGYDAWPSPCDAEPPGPKASSVYIEIYQQARSVVLRFLLHCERIINSTIMAYGLHICGVYR
uniref:Uncharacterized protein n=1 Tax=Sipha flava TaxID=143950 RepID=A0A2S2QHT5_9HEMI